MPRAKGSGGVSVYAVDMPRSAWENLIDEWIFNERDRNIIKRRLLDGLTFQELADEFNISVRQVKRITAKGSESLVRHMK